MYPIICDKKEDKHNINKTTRVGRNPYKLKHLRKWRRTFNARGKIIQHAHSFTNLEEVDMPTKFLLLRLQIIKNMFSVILFL